MDPPTFWRILPSVRGENVQMACDTQHHGRQVPVCDSGSQLRLLYLRQYLPLPSPEVGGRKEGTWLPRGVLVLGILTEHDRH